MMDENEGNLDSGTWEFVGGPSLGVPGLRALSGPTLRRLKVPGGWLVSIAAGFSHPLTFYPDADHEWNPPIFKK